MPVLTLILMSAGAAAAAQGLPPELRRCMAETAESARLACFDREAARLVGATDAPAMTPEERFGLRGDVARETLEREKAARQSLERLEARVTAVASGPTGDWVVTLDNGQAWAQVPSGTRYTIRVGDAVTISSASLGSYMLTGESGRSVRVRRRR